MRKASYGEWVAAIAVMAVTAAIVGHAWGGSGVQDNNAVCVRRVTAVNQAILSYTQDYDEKFPALGDSTRFLSDLDPYLPPGYPRTCPETNLPYAGNGALQFRSAAIITDTRTTELLRDGAAHSDGISTIGFADGHVERGGIEQGQYELLCQERAHDTVQAMLMYAQDYDDVLPATGSAAEMQSALNPYQRGDVRRLYCPATRQPFTPNPDLSRQPLSALDSSDRYEVVALRDPASHANGVSTVAYLDGHVERDGVNHANADTTCYTNLNSLRVSFAMYAQDYDGYLPPSMTTASLGKSLAPYLGGSTARPFFCPDTGLSYGINSSLAGTPYDAQPLGTELAWESSPHHDGYYGVIIRSDFIRGEFVISDKRPQWTPLALATGHDNAAQLLWMHANGTKAAMLPLSPALDASGSVVSVTAPTPAAPRLWDTSVPAPASLPYTPIALSLSPNQRANLLWDFVSLFPNHDIGSYPGLNVYFYPYGYAEYFYPDTIAGYRYILDPTPPLVIQALDPTTGTVSSARATTPLTGWKAKALATGPDGTSQQLWVSEDGGAATITPPLPDTVKKMNLFVMRMGYGWHAVDFTISQDGMWKVLWQRRDGAAALMEATTNIRGLVTRSVVLGPDPGWTAVGVASGALDNRAWVLWRNRDGLARVQPVASGAVPQAAIPVPALAGEVVPQGISVGGDGQLRIWGGRHTDGAASVSLLSPAGEVITSRILLPPSS